MGSSCWSCPIPIGGDDKLHPTPPRACNSPAAGKGALCMSSTFCFSSSLAVCRIARIPKSNREARGKLFTGRTNLIYHCCYGNSGLKDLTYLRLKCKAIGAIHFENKCKPFLLLLEAQSREAEGVHMGNYCWTYFFHLMRQTWEVLVLRKVFPSILWFVPGRYFPNIFCFVPSLFLIFLTNILTYN